MKALSFVEIFRTERLQDIFLNNPELTQTLINGFIQQCVEDTTLLFTPDTLPEIYYGFDIDTNRHVMSSQVATNNSHYADMCFELRETVTQAIYKIFDQLSSHSIISSANKRIIVNCGVLSYNSFSINVYYVR